MIQSARKAEILSVSAKLFRERGFNAVTMRDIAQALDIKAASLYNHIKSKQEILSEVVMVIASEFTAGMDEIVAEKVPAIDKLKKLIILHIDITLRDPNEMASVNNDWMHLEEKERREFIKMREYYEDKFREIVKDGINSGEIHDLNVDVVIFSMLSTLRTLYLWYGRKKIIRTEILKQDLTQSLLHGIIKH
jgi:TetR/AcrR family transcriptional regulator, cholesterol catabolism regulator